MAYDKQTKTHFFKKKLSMVVCAYNLSTWKAEARGAAVLGQPSHTANLRPAWTTLRPYLKNKKEKRKNYKYPTRVGSQYRGLFSKGLILKNYIINDYQKLI